MMEEWGKTRRIERIMGHPLFREELAELERLEAERIFCRHGLEHLLSVARLASLWNAEEGLGFSKEVIYAAALLHDIGRGAQYRDGTPHEVAGAELAGRILPECGFSREECALIVNAIGSHRSRGQAEGFAALLYRADKKCRPCYWCPAAAECNWPEEKRNFIVI